MNETMLREIVTLTERLNRATETIDLLLRRDMETHQQLIQLRARVAALEGRMR